MRWIQPLLSSSSSSFVIYSGQKTSALRHENKTATWSVVQRNKNRTCARVGGRIGRMRVRSTMETEARPSEKEAQGKNTIDTPFGKFEIPSFSSTGVDSANKNNLQSVIERFQRTIEDGLPKILLEESNIDTKPFEDAIRPMVRSSNNDNDTNNGMSEEAARDVSQFLEAHMGAILAVFREEMELIENGDYKFPYDMNPLTAPSYQTNILQVLRISRDNIRDQQQKVQPRRNRKDGGQDLLSTFEIDEKRYPKYYAQNFHYQTDGWLSNESARLYDFQVETLFLGSADTMRRRCLPYLNMYLKTQKKNAKLLDVATGTGRFLTFVRDNNPDLECTATDLSPFYLAKARENNKAFDKKGGKLTLLEANSEDLSTIEDGSFDAVTCVYLFHELPLEAQKNVAKEMSRVLKPGGKLFFVDSAQKGDGKRIKMEKEIDQALANFPVFSHEPYYRAYSELDLKNLFFEYGNGMVCEAEELAWVSKTLVFKKPGGDETTTTFSGASVVELKDDDDIDPIILATAKDLKAEMKIEVEPAAATAAEELGWAGEASTAKIFEKEVKVVAEPKGDDDNISKEKTFKF